MSAPTDKGGSTAKCPQCQTLFEVPVPPAAYNGKDVLKAEEIIEFYCPNEHYLRAPARLQGKPGQCPHCNERFTVPMLPGQGEGDPGAPAGQSGLAATASPIPLASSNPQADARSGGPPEVIQPATEPALPAKSGGSSSRLAPDFSFVEKLGSTEYEPMPEPPIPHSHPLAALFERVWEESDREAIVELELKTGERIAPLNYAHDVSRGQFGVFAVRAHDGSQTVIVVAWDDISRITVKQLKELPPTMFN